MIPRARRYCLFHSRCDGVASNRDTDHDSNGAAQGGQVLRAVQRQMGCSGQEQRVLVAGRLALHRVDHDGPAGAGGLGDLQFDRRGECATATTGQVRSVEAGHEALLP